MSKYVKSAISWNPKLTGQKNSDPFVEALWLHYIDTNGVADETRGELSL